MTIYGNTIQKVADKQKGLITTNQGGLAYRIDEWRQFRRFLILGAEQNTMYESADKIANYNVEAVSKVLAIDGIRAIDTIVDVSDRGLAFKNEPALLALALAASYKNEKNPREAEKVRAYALTNLPKIARTSTHLFHFADYVDKLRGWGSGLRRGIGAWYLDKSDMALANQVTKYVQRDGWSHADILRLTHPIAKNDVQNAIFKYIVDGDVPPQPLEKHPPTSGNKALDYLNAVEAVKRETDIPTIVAAIRNYNLPREVLPTLALNDARVWEALLTSGAEGMPMTAMLRNLGNMSKLGLTTPLSDASKFVIDKLHREDLLRDARIHPIDLIKAKLTYQQGHGTLGSSTWKVDQSIVAALEDAFYLSFGTIEPTNKRGIIAIDVSASMTWTDMGGIKGFNPRLASAVLAMVTLRTEDQSEVVTFSGNLGHPKITKNDSLNTVMNAINRMPAGGTDCALPMQYALKEGRKADYFAVYTDNETGRGNPSDALREYRRKSGIHDAKLLVNAMQANKVSIADPTDPNMLDLCGFDSSAPQMMAAFIRGDI